MHSFSYRTVVVAAAALAAILADGGARAEEFYSFDGVGFPTCYNVTTVHNATSVDESAFFFFFLPFCSSQSGPLKRKKNEEKKP